MKKLGHRCLVLLVGAVLTAGIGYGQLRSGKFGVGFNASGYLMQSDFTAADVIKFGGGVGMTWSVIEHLGLRINLSGGQVGWSESGVEYITTLAGANFYVSGDLFPHQRVNPFVFAGVGAVYYDPRPITSRLLSASIDKIDVIYLGGVGVDVFFNEFISVTVSGEMAMTNTDNLDALKSGNNNDYFYRANLEFRYYFFDQDFITKLLEAMKGRK